MNLVHDYISPTPGGGKCRIRLYLPEEKDYAAVVICTEVHDNAGMSITNCAEVLAAQVMAANRLDEYMIWVEHYEDGARGTTEDPHTFDLVNFTNYEPVEFVSARGWSKRIGRPSWQALDRATVEALIGSPL